MTYVWKNKNLNFDFCPVLGSLGGMFFGPGAFATRADFQGDDPWKYDDALLTRWDAFPTNEVQDWKASLRDDVKLFDAGRQAALEMAALEAGPDWLSGALLALGRSAVEVRWYSVTNATEAMRAEIYVHVQRVRANMQATKQAQAKSVQGHPEPYPEVPPSTSKPPADVGFSSVQHRTLSVGAGQEYDAEGKPSVNVANKDWQYAEHLSAGAPIDALSIKSAKQEANIAHPRVAALTKFYYKDLHDASQAFTDEAMALNTRATGAALNIFPRPLAVATKRFTDQAKFTGEYVSSAPLVGKQKSEDEENKVQQTQLRRLNFKQVLPTMNGVCTYLDAFKSADMAEEWGDVDVVPETRKMLCKAAAMAGVESSENEDEYERASIDELLLGLTKLVSGILTHTSDKLAFLGNTLATLDANLQKKSLQLRLDMPKDKREELDPDKGGQQLHLEPEFKAQLDAQKQSAQLVEAVARGIASAAGGRGTHRGNRGKGKSPSKGGQSPQHQGGGGSFKRPHENPQDGGFHQQRRFEGNRGRGGGGRGGGRGRGSNQQRGQAAPRGAGGQ